MNESAICNILQAAEGAAIASYRGDWSTCRHWTDYAKRTARSLGSGSKYTPNQAIELFHDKYREVSRDKRGF